MTFLLLVFAMRGRWSPRAAKRDFEERERLVAAELARVRGDMESTEVAGDASVAAKQLASAHPDSNST